MQEKTTVAADSRQRWNWGQFGVMAACVLAFSSSVAESATPTDVFYAVDEVIVKVRLLHEANYSDGDAAIPLIRPSDRRPRHVLQLSRSVLEKANILAAINGGMTVAVPSIPNREIKPDDVLASVQTTGRVIDGLLSIFAVEGVAAPTSPAGNKTPNDVYEALYRLSIMIDGLGIPATVPNDVYRIAETIALELADIAERSGMPLPVPTKSSTGKKPKDVYNRAFELVDSLQQLLEKRSDLVPAGGLAAPQEHKGPIKPEDVRYVLNDLLAEIASMQVAGGSQKKIELAAIPSGRSPSDVYDQLTNAIALIDVMIAHV